MLSYSTREREIDFTKHTEKKKIVRRTKCTKKERKIVRENQSIPWNNSYVRNVTMRLQIDFNLKDIYAIGSDVNFVTSKLPYSVKAPNTTKNFILMILNTSVTNASLDHYITIF